MGTIAVIVLSVIGLMLLLVVMIRVASAAVGAKVRKTIAARYPPEVIVLQDALASSLGFTSKGAVQIRPGNGGLVLTREALHFLPIVGDELHIPLAEVTGVSVVKSHLGKTIFRPLLKVEWTTDSMAWFVSDVAEWTRVLPETLTASRKAPT